MQRDSLENGDYTQQGIWERGLGRANNSTARGTQEIVKLLWAALPVRDCLDIGVQGLCLIYCC